MTRSGVVQSVHAFGEDPELALLFTIFMVVILVFSFGLVIYRLPLLRARNELDSWVSREAAFLANNWILLFSAFFVLFATMFPTLSEAVTGERLTVGPPFFNKWMLPIGLILLLLTGIGPLLAWRKSTLANLRSSSCGRSTGRRSSPPARWSLARRPRLGVGHLLRAVRVRARHDRAGVHPRRAASGARATGTDICHGDDRPRRPSRRRYGGYIVHLGIVLMFLGFAGEGFKQEEQVAAEARPADDGRRFHGPARRAARHDDAQKQMVTGHVTVFEDGKADRRR